MIRNRIEDKAVDILEEKFLNRGYFKVKKRVNLHQKIGNLWDKKYQKPRPLFQPEIDIILEGRDLYTFSNLIDSGLYNNEIVNKFERKDLLRAIEVKRFTIQDKYKYSYYKGLEQAIAYLRFGFDCVALWHILDREVILKNIEYVNRTWAFILELSLPLDFSYFIMDGDIISRFKINENQIIKKEEIDDPKYIIWWRRPNPYLRTQEGLKFRTLINEWLEND